MFRGRSFIGILPGCLGTEENSRGAGCGLKGASGWVGRAAQAVRLRGYFGGETGFWLS